MAQSNDKEILQVVHPICCGIDVHKARLSACIVFTERDGSTRSIIKEFETLTDDLLRLRQWLLEHGCGVVAMESTGVYWWPVHNVLEGHVEVILVNARHMRNVPGRKTDIEDCKWLAGLLRNGLVRGSFIPPKEVRQWRELSRLRRKHVETLADYKKRTQKLFESANIKIDTVVSDLFGVTGRNLMNLLISGEELSMEEVGQCVRGRLKGKVEQLYRAIQGFFEEHHRFQLSSLLRTIDMLQAEIQVLEQRISELMSDHGSLLEALDEVPGIDKNAARNIIAEIGPTLEAFPNEEALCAWAGLCPGNNESAGKRHSGRSPVRRHHLKTLLVQVSWAAVKKKGSYYKAKYYRLKARCGPKKAIIAIAHRILKAVYFIIKHRVPYRELGEHYLDRASRAGRIWKLRKQAEALGYQLVPVTS